MTIVFWRHTVSSAPFIKEKLCHPLSYCASTTPGSRARTRDARAARKKRTILLCSAVFLVMRVLCLAQGSTRARKLPPSAARLPSLEFDRTRCDGRGCETQLHPLSDLRLHATPRTFAVAVTKSSHATLLPLTMLEKRPSRVEHVTKPVEGSNSTCYRRPRLCSASVTASHEALRSSVLSCSLSLTPICI